MRHLIRIAAALAALVALAGLTTATALAGNFAEVAIIAGAGDPPVAGEEREFRFVLLQHGVSPIDSGNVEVQAWLSGGGERVTVTATSIGDGEWVATVAFPSEGDWQLRVMHSQFETSPATAIAVAPGGRAAWLPPVASVAGLGLAAVLLLAAARLMGDRRPAERAPVTGTMRAG
jgi:YtkA-like protein